MELYRVFDIFTLFADQVHLQAGPLKDLAHGRVIGELVSLYVAAGRELHTELAVEVKKNIPFHEDRDRKVPARMLVRVLFLHEG